MGGQSSSEILDEKCQGYEPPNYEDYSSSYENGTYGDSESVLYFIDDGHNNNDSAGLRLVLKAFFSVLCFFGLMANVIVFMVTVQQDRLRNKPSNVYLLLLAIADIIFITCMMIRVVYDDGVNFPFSTFVCKSISGVDVIAQNMSSLLLAGIAWDRMLLLFSPSSRTSGLAWFLCLICFGLSSAASISYWISHRVVANCQIKVMTCTYVLVNSTTNEVINESEYARIFGLRATIITFIVGYLITFIHLFIFGLMIITKVCIVAYQTKHAYNNSQGQRYQRIVTIRILSLIGAFVVCHSPFWILTILNESEKWYGEQKISPAWYMPVFKCSIYLAHTNSAINPMLYAAMNDDFKHNLRSTVATIRHKLKNPGELFPHTQDYPATQSLHLITSSPKPQSTENDGKVETQIFM